MNRIGVFGAGNIGSRHLQALKAVNVPLEILVIDPNQNSLKVAKERYESVPSGKYIQSIEFASDFKEIKRDLDIAIIATLSNVRRNIIENLFNSIDVRAFLLEKILFDHIEDYTFVEKLLKEHSSKAWVNCTRRLVPFYYDNLKNWYSKQKTLFLISGSRWNLLSNIIHYIDLISFILDDIDFIPDFQELDLELIPRNISSYIELNGLIKLKFKRGSLGIINCFSEGNQPPILDIASKEVRTVVNEVEGTALAMVEGEEVKEFDSKIPYTSQLTTLIVEDIIQKNTCMLTPYTESMKFHLSFYEPLFKLLNSTYNNKFTAFPFT